MTITHTLDDLKYYHNEAISFFGSELMLLKEAIPQITEDRLAKAAVLLMSCGQTGAALLQLATQVDTHTTAVAMLARSFMETITNFCYAGVCDEDEFRAFCLHPIYKFYHNVDLPKMDDDWDKFGQRITSRQQKQEKLKENAIVQEALTLFSETKPNLKWTNKSLGQRIEVLKERSNFLDIFFTLNKIQYYADASEALHGSLYGCTYNLGTFDPYFNSSNADELAKKQYLDCTRMLLHVGILIHETLTFITKSCDIGDIWGYSYDNRSMAVSLLTHIGKGEVIDD